MSIKLFSSIEDIHKTYNRKKGQLDYWLSNQLELFAQGKNARKNKKAVISKGSATWRNKHLMRIAKKKVKQRDKVCQRCGSKKLLQCSHIISVAADKRLSRDPENMKLLCYACHIHRWHKRPNEAHEWLEVKRPGRWEALNNKKIATSGKGSITPTEYEEIERYILSY